MSADRYRVGKQARFAVAEFLINLLLVFATYRLLVLQGGLEVVGLWSSLYAITTLIRIGDAGMANATLRFVAITPDKATARRYLETGMIANAGLYAGLALAGMAVLAPLASGWIGAEHAAIAARVLPVMLLGFFLMNLAGAVLGGLQGLHRGYRRSQIAVLGTAIQLAAALLLVPRLGIEGLAWAQVLQHGATIGLGWLVARVEVGGGWLPCRFDRRAFAEMLRYSVASLVANLANGLFEPACKILMGQIGGLAALGIFELAYKTVWLARNVVAAGLAATVPAMSSSFKADPAAARALYQRSRQLTRRAMVPLAAVLVTSSPIVSWLWLGVIEGSYCLSVLIIAVGVTSNTIGAPAYHLGTASGRQRGNIAVNCLTLALLVILAAALAPLQPSFAVTVAASLALGVNGVLIRRLNEPLLPRLPPAVA